MAWSCAGKTNDELISNLRLTGYIRSSEVEAALKKVDRAHYCPDATEAYEETSQVLGPNATIPEPWRESRSNLNQNHESDAHRSSPLSAAPTKVHCYAAEALLPFLTSSSSVLDIGSGSGYLMAVLYHLIESRSTPGTSSSIKAGPRVIGIEHLPTLAKQSQENLEADGLSKQLKSGSIEVICGEGSGGRPDEGPYDAIHVGVACPPGILPPLERQLAAPGRLFIPIQDPQTGERDIYHIDKTKDGRISRTKTLSLNAGDVDSPKEQRSSWEDEMAAADQKQSKRTASSRSNTTMFLILSLLFHLLFTVSIFDIYFTSPVVHPTQRFSSLDTYLDGDSVTNRQVRPPADRLVLIVGDGLRADTLFKEHSGHMLPSWAAADYANHLATPSDYPWTSALDINQTGSHSNKISWSPFFAAPHLRDVILNRGAWGVSHTRVPTESRPGHVALIAGMYEDVSAVTKGWKTNPVDFDSLMNVSSHAYTFGSPDILPMFAKGAPAGRVDMWMYDESAEDFSKDATHLDLWVLEQLEQLFERASSNDTLKEQLRQPGNVFFLHLLGLDTTGHTYRPQSQEYVGNLMVVDAITRRVEELFEAFFGSQDNQRTAWIFSADHGMSSKGNHGDGEPANTRTPLVAWGSGVRKPKGVTSGSSEGAEQLRKRRDELVSDDYFADWKGLDTLWREDVEQADITALMATLLGLPLPSNSEGRLPLDYVDFTPEQSARAMLANALEVLEIYKVKHHQRQARMIRYYPFSRLAPVKLDDGSTREVGQREVSVIKDLISRQQYEAAIESSRHLIDVALEGARYLQTYDWLLLVSIITAGYLGSIMYGIIFVIHAFVLRERERASLDEQRTISSFSLGRVIAMPILGIFFAKFQAEKAPFTYFAYLAFATLYWVRVVDQRGIIVLAWNRALESQLQNERVAALRLRQEVSSAPAVAPPAVPGHAQILGVSVKLAALLVLIVGMLELIVFGYLHRFAWSIGFFLLGGPWLFFTLDDGQRSKNEALILLWGLSCVATGLFTIGGVDKDESLLMLGLTGLLFTVAGVIVIRSPSSVLSASRNRVKQRNDKVLQRTLLVLKIQTEIVVLTTLTTISSGYSLRNKLGLPLVNQVTGWTILGSSLMIPFLFGFQAAQPSSHRLAILIFGFASVFILLSLRDEAFFYGVYTLMLLLWAKVEGVILEEKVVKARKTGAITGRLSLPRRMGLEEVRMSIVFLFLLHVGFFGTGNIASISSFYLSPVYRLVPIFAPFTMAALLILKILIPFVILCSVFHSLCSGRPSGRVMGDYEPGEEPYSDGEEADKPDSNGSASQQRPTKRPSKIALELGGPPLLGQDSIGGLGLPSSYPAVLTACIAADVLALNFLFSVRTTGAWLEIGQSITHFVMANMLIVFMWLLTWLVGRLY